MHEALFERYEQVQSRITAACQKVQRDPQSVELICVSKRHSFDKMQALEKQYPQQAFIFGENYVQEAREKSPQLQRSSRMHLIGPLQSNKAKHAVSTFDLIQSVHSEKTLKALNKEAGKSKKLQAILLQVNISDDHQKSGFLPEQLPEVLQVRSQYEHIDIQGLMTITQLHKEVEAVRPDFARMHKLRETLNQEHNLNLKVSMGMSADYEIAIEEGADLIRVGSSIFGPRV